MAFAAFSAFTACGPGSFKQLPILGARQAYMHTVNGKQVIDTQYHQIPRFSCLDQDSVYVNNETLKEKLYVADFFFTSCPTICPTMQKNMLRLATQFKDNPKIAFVSYTIDPEHDGVSRLKRYEKQIGASFKNWYFLTGNRDAVYALAEKGYYASASRDTTAPGGFIHSGALILVDNQRRIRGVYDGTKEDEVATLAQDIHILSNQNSNSNSK